jgi:glycosyltransferase involved in cell wall biosynthesis
LRIGHLNEPGAGGSFGIMVALAERAVERGHDVHAIYSSDRADPAMVEQLRRSGAQVHVSAMRRAVGPWDAKDGLQLRRLLRRLGKFDVIHSHSSKAGVLARLFGAGCGRVQVYSPHGFYTMTGNAPAYVGIVERVLSRVSDQIIAVSSFERAHALELGIAPDKVSVVPNGLRPSPALPRAEARRFLGLPDDAFVVGFVGRMEEQKNPLGMVETMAVLSARDVVGIMIGEGPLRPEAEKRAAASGRSITFAGAVAAKPLFSAFDVLLCTSRYEGMPVAFLESLNAGVPVVSYPVGGTDELIEEGVTGFVVPASPSTAAVAVERIMGMSPDERSRLKEACLRKAADHTDRTMGDATLALYERLLG